MTPEQQREMEDDLAMEALTDGEYYSQAVKQYAGAYGEASPDQAWILSPFDTWEKNPYYVGPPVPHPEDPEGPCEDVPYPCWTPSTTLDPAFDDDMPF